MKKGDLVHVSSKVTLLQFHAIMQDIDPYKTYIGPSPMKSYQLDKPMSLLLIDTNLLDGKYIKVWCNGEAWYVDEHDINIIQEDA